MKFIIYSDSPQNANFGEFESFLVAVQSVKHFQETGQCISGRIVANIDNYRIVVARFSHCNWDFDSSNMAFYNRLLDRKEKAKKI